MFAQSVDVGDDAERVAKRPFGSIAHERMKPAVLVPEHLEAEELHIGRRRLPSSQDLVDARRERARHWTGRREEHRREVVGLHQEIDVRRHCRAVVRTRKPQLRDNVSKGGGGSGPRSKGGTRVTARRREGTLVELMVADASP